MAYYRPIPMTDRHRPEDAQTLAGGWCWFTHAQRIERGVAPCLVPAKDIPEDVLGNLTRERPAILGLSMAEPQIMGILNVTPDSFSDGGLFDDFDAARARALEMVKDGATIIDIGGESTRPGAKEVPATKEAQTVLGAIGHIRPETDVAISVDTRKAAVAESVGAFNQVQPWMINDVSAATFDPSMAAVMAQQAVPVCLMHSVGTPETMQAQAQYRDVLLDVYDHLAERIAAVVAAGVSPDHIIVDPGIGFGKTQDHNLRLMRNLSLFHALGCPVLIGASRKRFIGELGDAPAPLDRTAGSVAVAMQAVRQGVQILRVHDTFETRQALSLHMAVS